MKFMKTMDVNRIGTQSIVGHKPGDHTGPRRSVGVKTSVVKQWLLSESRL
jgi:hypothetical protein